MAPTPEVSKDEPIVFKWMYGDVLNSPKFSKFSAALNPMRWSAQAQEHELQGFIMSANPAERDGNTMKRPIRVAWRAASGKGLFTCASFSELRAEIAKIRGHEARLAERKALADLTGDQPESGSEWQDTACSAFQSELIESPSYREPGQASHLPEGAVVEVLTVEEEQAGSAGPRSWRTSANNRSDGRPPVLASNA